MKKSPVFLKHLNIFPIFVGLFLVIIATFAFLFSQDLIKYKIHQNLIIKPNSTAYEYWLNPPAKILRKYYLFDVINPHEIKNGGKPELVQRGPYVYSEKWEKRNVEFLGDEVLKYTPVVTLHFEPSLSVGNESDLITFLNIPALGVIEQAIQNKFDDINFFLVNNLLSFFDTKLFLTRTVGELISGYNEPLIELGNFYLSDKFSLMNEKNGTEYQTFSILTGNKDALKIGKILTWNNKEKLDFWDSDSANMINGSDGTFYRYFLEKDTKLYSFSSDLCRSFNMVYLRDNEIDGIKTYDFHLPENIFYNATLNPENEGFCEDGKCLGNGVLNVSNCYGGVSGFVSQPHFLNSDSKFLESVSGLDPKKEYHDLILQLEPTTGVPLKGNVRFQINFYLPSNDKINLVQNIKPVLLPIFWFDENISINKETQEKLGQVTFIVKLVNILPLILISIGFMFIFIPILIILKKNLATRETKFEQIYAEKKKLVTEQNPENVL